jgi:hypothetical protein
MTEEILEEELFLTQVDAEGNITKVPLVWHTVISPATIEFYDCSPPS